MASIESRIVSLKFDGSKFMSGAAQAQSALQKLKESLNMSGAAKSLESVGDKVSRFSFGGIADRIKEASSNFGILDVAAGVTLGNIASKAIATGLQLVKSFTVAPILDGLREYETQINSVQTILANTQHKGTTIDQVNAALDELNVYADKTIYNFAEMTRNIGLFTAAGVGLEDSVAAIKGISNLAALSGSSSAQATTAMTQLSQAIASGTIRLQDWNSVQNAGMGGERFQELLKTTARIHGEAVDSAIESNGSFRESLKEGWLTSEVLLESLSILTGDLTEQQLLSMGYSQEQATELLALAKAANDSATKVRTFTQLMDTLKESVGSGWAQTWELIFGDFDEASAFFTEVYEALDKVIQGSSNARNSVLKDWKDLGGRDDLVQTIRNLANAVWKPIEAIGKAWRSVFKGIDGSALKTLTGFIQILTSKMVMSEWVLIRWTKIWRALFSVLSIGWEVIKVGWEVFKALAQVIAAVFGFVGGDLASNLLAGVAVIADWISAIAEWVRGLKLAERVHKLLNPPVQAFVNLMRSAHGFIYNFVAGLFGLKFLQPVGGWFKSAAESAGKLFEKISNTAPMRALGALFSDNAARAGEMGAKMAEVVKGWKLDEKAKAAGEAVGAFFVKIADKVPWEKFEAYADSAKKKFVEFLDYDNSGNLGWNDALLVWEAFVSRFQKGWKEIQSSKVAEFIRDLGSDISAGFESIKSNINWDHISAGLASLGESAKKLGSRAWDIAAEGVRKFGDALSYLREKIKELFGGDKGGEGPATAVSAAGTAAAAAAESSAGRLGKISALFAKWADDIKRKARELGLTAENLEKIGNFFENLWNKFADSVESGSNKAWNVLKTIGAKLGSAIKEMFSKAYDYLYKTDAGDLLFDALALTTIGTFVWKMRGLISSLTGFLDKAGGMFDGISDAIGAFTGHLQAMQLKVKAQAILLIAGAILVLAAAMLVIAQIDSNRLQEVMFVMVGAMTGVAAIMKVMSSLPSGASGSVNLIALGASMVGVSIALLLIASAMKKMAELDTGELVRGSVALGVITGAMVGLMYALQKFSSITSSTSVVGKSIIKEKASILGMALSMVAIAGSMLLMAKAVEKLGQIENETLMKGLATMSVILLVIGLFEKLGGAQLKIGNALSLLIMATAMTQIASALQEVGSKDLGPSLKGLAIMAVAFGIIGGAMRLIGPDALAKAALMAVVMLTLKSIGGTIQELADIPWMDVAKGLGVMAATLLVLGVAMKFMTGNLAGAGALLLMAVAIGVMAGSILLLTQIPWQAAAVGLTIVAVALGVLIAAGYAAQPVIVIVVALAAAVALLGIGIGLLGLGVGALAVGLVLLAGLGAAGIAALVTGLNALISLIPYAAQKFAEGMVRIAEVIGENKETWREAMSAIIYALIMAIDDNIPHMEQTMKNLIDAGLRIINEKTPDIVQTGWNVLMALLEGIKNNIGQVADTATDIIIAFMDAMQRNYPRIIDKGAETLLKFIEGLTASINKYAPRLRQAGKDLAFAIADGMTGGLASKIGDVAAKARDLAKGALNSAKSWLGIASPSKEFKKIGRFVGDGMAIGMDDRVGLVSKSAQNLSKTTMEEAMKAFDNLKFDGDMDPTIRPVVDLTNVEQAAKTIDNKFSDMAIGLNGSSSLANSATSYHSVKAPPTNVEQQPKQTEIVFNQNNYSPEPLSQFDIYRRTQSMLARVGEQVRS